jgi:hypothetical protein
MQDFLFPIYSNSAKMKGWGEMVESKADLYNFAIQVAKGRWTSMFAAFLIMATSGGPLLFPLFSSQIIKNLGYTDSMLMNAPPIAIIIDSPQAVEEEQNSSTNQVEADEDIIIVEQEQNSSEKAHMPFFATIFKKPKRGEDYGILQAIISYDMLIIFLYPKQLKLNRLMASSIPISQN